MERITDFFSHPGFLALASFVTVVGFILSIAFFWYQTRGQRDSDRKIQAIMTKAESLQAEAKASAKRAKDLADKLSTQYQGDFPDYLPAVEAMINRASSSVKIMSMISSHGSFSARPVWERIRLALLTIEAKKREKPDFEAVLIYGTMRGFRSISHYYLKELSNEGWVNWRNKEEPAVAAFFEKEFELNRSQIASMTAFEYIRGRFCEHMNVCRQVYGHFERHFSVQRLPMYCWIIDGKEAIFAISTEDRHGRFKGTGIYTTDSLLVSSLDQMFEHFRAISQDCSKDPTWRPKNPFQN